MSSFLQISILVGLVGTGSFYSTGIVHGDQHVPSYFEMGSKKVPFDLPFVHKNDDFIFYLALKT